MIPSRTDETSVGLTMMPQVELVYFTGCPHVERARAVLREAFQKAGRAESWREWDQLSAETPPRVLGYGSPTILVDGRDVLGAVPTNGGRACRADGVPSPEVVAAALAATVRVP